LGASAAPPLAALLADARTDEQRAGFAADVLSRLGADHPEEFRAALQSGLGAMKSALESAAITNEEREGLRKKTGSLAWAVGNRPAGEHDLLAHDLVETLLHATDAPQAGTLAWGITNLKGLTAQGRLEAVRSIVEGVASQADAGLRACYAWAVRQIVAAGYGDGPLDRDFDELVSAVERAGRNHAGDAPAAKELDALVAALRQFAEKRERR
jgi:hypothetical protein